MTRKIYDSNKPKKLIRDNKHSKLNSELVIRRDN